MEAAGWAGWRNDGCTSLVGDANLSGQNNINNNLTNNAWNMTNNNIWNVSTNVIGTTCYDDDWTNQAAANVPATSVVHALLLGSNTSTLPDPHMMCLKLGKRHYCDNTVVPRRYVATADESSSAAKRCRPPYSCYVTAVARCQVEGCHVSLDNVKEYYKKHKVCEIHSKAPKVVVLGIQQRFCQQCSRFHGVTEFDEAKRSCRRRLEGHNQRRRKGTNSINSLPRNFPHSQENNTMMKQRLQSLSTSPPQSKQGYALSLLSSPKIEPWISSGDLSSRCSDALYELIVANRAASFAGHFLSQQNSSHPAVTGNTMYTQHNNQMWDRFSDGYHTTMTLDLMEAPALDFGLLSMKGKSKEPEEWTEYCWSAFGGANVV